MTLSTFSIQHKNGHVELTPTGDGRQRVTVRISDENAFVTGPHWTTAYPGELVAAILVVKGPA